MCTRVPVGKGQKSIKQPDLLASQVLNYSDRTSYLQFMRVHLTTALIVEAGLRWHRPLLVVGRSVVGYSD